MATEQEITGNTEIITKATDDLIKYLAGYFEDNKITFVDAFMVAHNLHKFVVKDIAEKWEAEGLSSRNTYRMADITFRKAMRTLRDA